MKNLPPGTGGPLVRAEIPVIRVDVRRRPGTAYGGGSDVPPPPDEPSATPSPAGSPVPRRAASDSEKFGLAAAIIIIPTLIVMITLITLIWRNFVGTEVPAWGWIALGAVILVITIIVIQRLSKSSISSLKKLTDQASEIHAFITAYRNHPLAYAVYVVGGWWILVWISWVFSGINSGIWNFLQLHIWGLTFWTPLIILPAVYLIKTEAKVIRGLGVAIAVLPMFFWYWALPTGTIPHSWWSWPEFLGTNQPKDTVLLPIIRAQKGEWTTPIDLQAEMRKHFHSREGGNYKLRSISGPGEAKLICGDTFQVVEINTGMKENTAPAEKISVRGTDDSIVVLIELTRKKRE